MTVNKCSICVHRHRAAIERDMVGGISVPVVAQQYNVSPDALYRHRRSHLTRPTPGNSTPETRERDAERREQNDRVVRAVQSKLAGQLNRAEARGDTLNAIRSARALLQATEIGARMNDNGSSVAEGDFGGSTVPGRIVITTKESGEARTPDEYRAWFNQLLSPDQYQLWWAERQEQECVEVWLPHNGRDL
jgi:hypothetical protein